MRMRLLMKSIKIRNLTIATAMEGWAPVHWMVTAGRKKVASTHVRWLDWILVSETYTGLTAKTFKERFYGHNANINNRDQTGTKLSQYIWDLKDNNIPFTTKWSILAKASAFNPVTKKCRWCLKEVYYILYKPETASLNSKTEAFGWCKHRKQWSLEKT